MKLWLAMIALFSCLSGFCDYQIGFEHLKEPDNSLSLETYKSQAEAGDSSAQALYGIFLYKKAEETVWAKERNELYREAAIWLKDAARQDEPKANYYLGYAYYTGHGVPKDKEKSLKSFKQAVEKGLSPAMRCLAYSFLEKDLLIQSLAWFSIVKEFKKNEADIEYWSDRLDTEMTADQVEEAKKITHQWLARISHQTAEQSKESTSPNISSDFLGDTLEHSLQEFFELSKKQTVPSSYRAGESYELESHGEYREEQPIIFDRQ